MINQSITPESALLMSKIEHLGTKNVPAGSIMLGALRPFELALQERNIITHVSPVPLWFLAETERNTFLWKNGLSLVHSCYFDFWVQVDDLIEKRKSQLDRVTPDNPFSGVLLGSTTIDPSSIDLERNYLEDIKAHFSRISLYAECLCHATNSVLEQMSPRITVALPFRKSHRV